MVRDCRKKRLVPKKGPGPDIGFRYRDRVPFSHSMQSDCDQVAEVFFSLDTLDAGPGCAVAKEDQSWDAGDAQISDDLRLLVDIDQAELDCLGQVISQTIQAVENGLAGRTPVCPEAEQHRLGGLLHLDGIILPRNGEKYLIHMHVGAFPFAKKRSG